MDYLVEHHLPGRTRLRLTKKLTSHHAGLLSALLDTQEGVREVYVNGMTGSVLLYHDPASRDRLLETVRVITRQDLMDLEKDVPPDQVIEPPSLFQSVFDVLWGWWWRSLLPLPLRAAITAWRALPYVTAGLDSFAEGQANVELLDATAITVSLLRGDVSGAGAIMNLLQLGDIIQYWTRRKSRESLASSLALDVDAVWRRNAETGRDEKIPLAKVALGDLLVVRGGTLIPVDGVVAQGEGSVNQASLTGEGLPVYKGPGLSVYAGTVLEEGDLIVRVGKLPDDSRLNQIGRLIDESEALKAQVQSRAERLADKVVPFSFLLALGTYLFTGNATKAASALVVDYSCAIKLTTPLTILSAMREGVKEGAIIKGGKYIEALRDADTVVFDKTGTLTVAEPTVSEVIPFGPWSREDALRLAACLEEHYPHSIAGAVVRQAEAEGLSHREEHAEVRYVIAHGLASTWRDKEVIIGSAHFVFEDQGVVPTEEQRRIIDQKGDEGSLLFLAIDGQLRALLVVRDPLRAESADVVLKLKETGFERLVMLTGDHGRVAARVAAEVGLDEYRAEMLPSDKIDAVNALKKEGRSVLMVGDGLNDSPSLAAADVGVSFRTASDVAREVADVVLTTDLTALPRARELSRRAMSRIDWNYGVIVAANSALLLGGIFGLLTPALSALLHNGLTVGLSLHSLQPLMDSSLRKEKP